MISAAQNLIDLDCGRTFKATTLTRGYGREAVRERWLWLDYDLLAVTTLINGNLAELPADTYRLWPYDVLPAARIELIGGARWSFTDAGLIRVTGQWGYSVTPPPIVVRATKEAVSDFYYSEERQPTGLKTGAEAYRLVRQLSPRVREMLSPLRRRSL